MVHLSPRVSWLGKSVGFIVVIFGKIFVYVWLCFYHLGYLLDPPCSIWGLDLSRVLFRACCLKFYGALLVGFQIIRPSPCTSVHISQWYWLMTSWMCVLEYVRLVVLQYPSFSKSFGVCVITWKTNFLCLCFPPIKWRSKCLLFYWNNSKYNILVETCCCIFKYLFQ